MYALTDIDYCQCLYCRLVFLKTIVVVLNTRIIQTHNAFRGSGDGVCLIELVHGTIKVDLVHSTISIVCSSSKCIRSRGQEVNGG